MDFPTGNVITAIATVIAVVVANRLSSKQSVDTKLWDLRRQAYGVILAELASVERICRSSGSIFSNLMMSISKPTNERLTMSKLPRTWQ